MTSAELVKLSLFLADRCGISQDRFALEVVARVMGSTPPPLDTPVGTAGLPDLEGPVKPLETEPPLETKKRIRKMKEAVATTDPRDTAAKIICKQGQLCSCSSCAKAVYQTNQYLTDKMSSTQFAAAFDPVGHDTPFPESFRIRAIDKCVMTDCPVCGGDMTLVLWGSKPEKDFDETGVGSIGGEV